jgi:hypothetical protein
MRYHDDFIEVDAIAADELLSGGNCHRDNGVRTGDDPLRDMALVGCRPRQELGVIAMTGTRTARRTLSTCSPSVPP